MRCCSRDSAFLANVLSPVDEPSTAQVMVPDPKTPRATGRSFLDDGQEPAVIKSVHVRVVPTIMSHNPVNILRRPEMSPEGLYILDTALTRLNIVDLFPIAPERERPKIVRMIVRMRVKVAPCGRSEFSAGESDSPTGEWRCGTSYHHGRWSRFELAPWCYPTLRAPPD